MSERAASSQSAAIRSILADPDYGELKTYILHYTGLEYFADKDGDLAARLSRRFPPAEAVSCSGYLQLLRSPGAGQLEMDQLVGELTIGETYFFRQPEHFELLRRTILPDILARNAGTRRLHIWSAGCATGPEPYSLALLLCLEFENQIAGWDVSIVATDINLEFLGRAKEGKFGEWALRETSKEMRERCFTHKDKVWTLRPEFRKRVSFQYHNLAGDAQLAGHPFDLIMCRNVLIYFSRETSLKVAEKFNQNLMDGGWLLVGYAEPNANLFESFETASFASVTAYRRRLEGSPMRPEWSPQIWPWQTEALLPPRAEKMSDAVVAMPPPPVASVADARLLADTGRWKEAEKIVTDIIAANPLNAAAHFTMGLMFDHSGLAAEARASFQKAIYVDRTFALAFYYVGVSLNSADDRSGAQKAFRNVMQLLRDGPDDEPVLHGDGMTAGELRGLTEMHMELLPN